MAALARPLPSPRRVWLDTRLMCVACGHAFFGVTPCGDGWTYLTCPHRRCRAHWVALTLPKGDWSVWLTARLGARVSVALLARLAGAVLDGPAYLQLEMSGREAYHHRHEPLTALVEALGL